LLEVLARILRLEEDKDLPTEPALKQFLVMLESL